MQVAIVQPRTRRLELAWNLERIEQLVTVAARHGASIACTPECTLDGYAFDEPAFQSAPERYCIDLDTSEHANRLASLARDVDIHLVAGMSLVEHGKDGATVYRNAAVVFGPDGAVLGKYCKVHSTLGNMEARFYTHGDAFPVFTIDGVGVGIMICYDRQVPETARLLRLNGAEIILNPSATGNFSRGWNTRLLQTRAYENGCFVVSVNHAWPRINGRSLACSPAGKVISRCPPWEHVKVVSLDIDQARNAATKIDTRRPSVYGALVSPSRKKKEE